MRKKQQRFADNAQCPHVIEPGKPSYHHMQGAWHTHYFHNSHPIVLELGCGQGAYTIGLAQQLPEKNFIGVDVKGARLWAGRKLATVHKLPHVAFLRANIMHMDHFFAPHEVHAIYLPFPDPRPKGRDAKRRLTSPRFWDVYRNILQPGGNVYLKTDNMTLFLYTLEVLRDREDVQALSYTEDLYRSDFATAHYGIQTDYEKRYLAQGIAIKYLQFSFSKSADTKRPQDS